MPRRRSLSMDPRNVARREKYAAIRAAGGSRELARQYQNRSWERIGREIAGITPTDSKFLDRSLSHLPSQERYKRVYHILRQAGFSSKEAKKLRATPPARLAFIIHARQRIKETGRRAPLWDYRPFDMIYTQDYVYKTEYIVTDEDGEEIKRKWVTVISHKELSPVDVEAIVIDDMAGDYGENFGGFVQVIAMKAGLPGGADTLGN